MTDTQSAVSAIIQNAQATTQGAETVVAQNATTQQTETKDVQNVLPVTELPSGAIEKEKEPEAKEQDKFAGRFAALAKRERLLQERESQAKGREQEYKDFIALKGQAKSNPLKYLASLGMSYNDITEFVLNGQELPKEKQFEQKLEELEGKLSAKEKAEQDREARQAQEKYDSIKSGFVGEIASFLDTNKDAYEFTLLQPEFEQIVYSVVEQYHSANHKILSVKEACDMVEKHYEDQYNKVRTLKKFNKVADEKQAPPKAEAKSSFTLSNGDQPAPTGQDKALSYEESLAKATAALKWV